MKETINKRHKLKTRVREIKADTLEEHEEQWTSAFRQWGVTPVEDVELFAVSVSRVARIYLWKMKLPPLAYVRWSDTGDSETLAPLTHYLRKQGYEEFCNEMLAARCLCAATLILDEQSTAKDKLFGAFRLGQVNEWMRYLREADREVKERGSKSKTKPWIKPLIKDLIAADPKAGAAELWKKLDDAKTDSDEPNIRSDGQAWIVYRDGNKLIAVDDRTGQESSISRRAFQRHAKKFKES